MNQVHDCHWSLSPDNHRFSFYLKANQTQFFKISPSVPTRRKHWQRPFLSVPTAFNWLNSIQFSAIDCIFNAKVPSAVLQNKSQTAQSKETHCGLNELAGIGPGGVSLNSARKSAVAIRLSSVTVFPASFHQHKSPPKRFNFTKAVFFNIFFCYYFNLFTHYFSYFF